jgi:hypothetical protein
MASNDLLYLPVSLGEAIDKLTILDIKLDKITDNRKLDVKKEYEILYEKLKDFIEKYQNLYNTMKKVNLLIWDMMDTLRDGDVDEKLYLKVCKECIEYNDIRFRVKNKINYVSNSLLKEQKSYKINRLIIVINNNLNNNETLLIIIKYFSFIYDEINIISDLNLDNYKTHFLYDNTILFKSNIENELFEYKSRVIIGDKEWSEDELYKLFNITKNELYKLFNNN